MGFKYGHVMNALHHVAPLVGLMGVPALVIGMRLWRAASKSHLAGLQTAATSLAVAGAGCLGLAFWIAWPPNPATLTLVALG